MLPIWANFQPDFGDSFSLTKPHLESYSFGFWDPFCIKFKASKRK